MDCAKTIRLDFTTQANPGNFVTGQKYGPSSNTCHGSISYHSNTSEGSAKTGSEHPLAKFFLDLMKNKEI